jgi:hypothetical protein
MSDIENGVCYLCGNEGVDSRDHVPPKAVLPKKYRSEGEDLITVPAHQRCNREWKNDDEYF